MVVRYSNARVHLFLRAPELWDEMGCSDTERLAFKPMQVTEDGFTDELLRQHTQEAGALEVKLSTMRNILEVRRYSRLFISCSQSDGWVLINTTKTHQHYCQQAFTACLSCVIAENRGTRSAGGAEDSQRDEQEGSRPSLGQMQQCQRTTPAAEDVRRGPIPDTPEFHMFFQCLVLRMEPLRVR